MRLTLRTLLAYLDDVLGPTEAREIGEKINNNPEASALVARIKDVLRRRRIGAPELSGPGSGPDPNLVSDYIENTLAPAEVVELERLCMESDMHLAEVAACHKVLTLVIGQPIDVPDEVRERMYVLGATTNGKKPADSEASVPLEEQPVAAGPEVTELSEGLPDYLKSKPLWPRISTAVIALLVGGVWLALVLSDNGIWGEPEPQSIAENSPANLPQQDDPVTVEPQLPVNSGQPQGGGQKTTKPPVAQPNGNNTAPPVSVNPTPPDDATLAKSGITGPEMPIPVPPTPTEAAPVPTPPPAVATEEANPKPVNNVTTKTPLMVANSDGVRLVKRPGMEHWSVLKVEPIVGDEELAVPAPFHAEATLRESLHLLFEPGTRVKRLSDTADGVPQLALNRGRIVFHRPNSSEAVPQFNLIVSGTQWTIKLTEPGTRVGIEAIPPTPEGPPGNTGLLVYQLHLGVAFGEVTAQLMDQAPQTISMEDVWTRWEPGSDQFVTTAQPFPAWSTEEGEFISPSARNLARIYEKEFLLDKTVAGSIGPVVQHRMASNSKYAAQTLGLLDEYLVLVPALAADHEETRVAAIEGLRQWVVQRPENGDLLIEEVSRNYPDDEIDEIIRLIWGYSAEDLEDPNVSRELVELLKHDSIEIRELAFFYIYKFAKTTKGYRPLLPAHERKAAILRLEDYLDQFESLGGS